MELKDIMSSRLYNCRKELGLSQAQIGKMLMISDKAVASYEQGRNNIPNVYLLQLSQIYGVSLNYLYGIQNHSFHFATFY